MGLWPNCGRMIVRGSGMDVPRLRSPSRSFQAGRRLSDPYCVCAVTVITAFMVVG